MAKLKTNDLLRYCNDFILRYIPYIRPEKILLGYQNRVTLPADNEYILIRLDSTRRIGTNVSDWSELGEDRLMERMLREYVVMIDFNSDDNDVVMEQAEMLETLGRSEFAPEFFNKYGIEFLYADEIQFLPYVDEAKQYSFCYRVQLHLSYWNILGVENRESADHVEINRIENVDVQYPQKNRKKE